jgi:hypothetical protein
MSTQRLGLVLYIKGYFHTLNPLKIVVFLILLFAAFVTIPDQTLELYRYTAQALAESYSSQGPDRLHFQDPQGLVGFIIIVTSVVLLSLVFLGLTTFLFALHDSNNSAQLDTRFSPSAFATIACAPCLAVGVGLMLAVVDLNAPKIHPNAALKLQDVLMTGARLSYAKDIKSWELIEKLSKVDVEAQLQVNAWLYDMAAMLVAVALALFILSRIFLRRPIKLGDAGASDIPLYVIGFGMPIVLSIVFVLTPIWLPKMLSSFGILCLFFATASLFLAALALAEARARMPLLFLLIVCGVIFSAFGLNDNHAVRTIQPSTGSQSVRLQPLTIAEGFTQWLNARNREDLAHYDSYPVYVIAAEGGGIYAAFRTATFLATLQDLCPRFSQHLFAVSSVSGGSVGAAVFNGLTRKIKQGHERFQSGSGCRKPSDNAGGLFFTDVAEEILKDDFLSPALGAFLFPDFLQRFLFFPVRQFDRSIALENSLEDAWDQNARYYYERFKEEWVDQQNPLSESYNASWNRKGDAPALFINTTEVASGRGRVIAPFLVETEEFSSFPLFSSSGANQPAVDITLSTAAVLSARFPWLTPPGSFRAPVSPRNQSIATNEPTMQKVQLVDGGYLDNSGVTTALVVIREIEAAVAKMSPSQNVQVNLIVLTSADFSDPNILLGDYTAPFQALLSTRTARGEVAVREAEHVFANETGVRSPLHSLGKVELRGYGYPLPLGWRLSPITRLLIIGQNDDRSRCSDDKAQVNCVSGEVVKEMNR